MSKHTVLYVRKYDFADDKGVRVSGCKVSYLDEPESDANTKGCPIMTITAPTDMWHSFAKVPGHYDLDFRQRPDAKGKPVLVLRSAQFLEPVQSHG